MTKITNIGDYDTLVDVQDSDTDSNIEYEIRWSSKYGYWCACPGYQNSKKKPKVCKHIKRFMLRSELINKYNMSIEDSHKILATAKSIWKGAI